LTVLNSGNDNNVPSGIYILIKMESTLDIKFVARYTPIMES